MKYNDFLIILPGATNDFAMKWFFLLFISLSLLRVSALNISGEKILLVRVNEIGIVTVNRDTVDADDLARYIQERLYKSFLGTGEMHDRIKLEKATATVPDLVSEVIIKEINDAQQRALIQVCLQKYSRKFDSLDKRRQDKLKKQFPVLFQTDFI